MSLAPSLWPPILIVCVAALIGMVARYGTGRWAQALHRRIGPRWDGADKTRLDCLRAAGGYLALSAVGLLASVLLAPHTLPFGSGAASIAFLGTALILIFGLVAGLYFVLLAPFRPASLAYRDYLQGRRVRRRYQDATGFTEALVTAHGNEYHVAIWTLHGKSLAPTGEPAIYPTLQEASAAALAALTDTWPLTPRA